jgi:hypothetical protein
LQQYDAIDRSIDRSIGNSCSSTTLLASRANNSIGIGALAGDGWYGHAANVDMNDSLNRNCNSNLQQAYGNTAPFQTAK